MWGICKSALFKKLQSTVLIVCMLVGMLSAGFCASAAEPTIDYVSMDESRTEITINFTGSISEATGTYIKKNIKLSQDGGSELALANFATVTMRDSAIVIRLPEPLTKSKNYFVIAKGALKNQTKIITTPNINGTDPTLKASESVLLDETHKKITIKFSTTIQGYPNDDSLKNGYITLARDGQSFDEVIKASQIQVNGSKAEIVITLDKELTGATAKVKIGYGRIKSTVTGNINLNDITTPAINAIVTECPKYKTAKVEYEGSKITMQFDRPIKRSQGVTVSMLKSNVKLSRNGGSFSDLGSNDKVEISGNDLILTLNYPIVGNNNRVSVNSGTLSSIETNDVLTQTVYTDYLNMGEEEETAQVPQYAGIVYDRANKAVRIYFTCPIRAVSTYKLLNGIDFYVNENWNKLEDYSNIEIYNSNSILVTLKNALSTSTRFRVSGGTVQDYSGNVQKSNLYTDFVSEKGTGNYTDEIEIDTGTDDEDTENTSTDDENTNPGDEENTSDDTTQPDDTTVIDPNPGTQIVDEVIVTLNGSAVDFSENTVTTDSAGNETHSVAIIEEKAEPTIVTKSQGVALSVVMPTLAYGGTVKIPGSIISLLNDKAGIITVECANAVQRVPLSLLDVGGIPDLMNSTMDNVTVELSIHRASGIYKTDLENAASKAGFSTVIAPVEFTIQYKSANTTRAITTFDQYIEKSFVLPSDADKSGTTVVRIETSGAVNHVPSNMSARENGDAYLTAHTRQNGVYAVIYSSRTYSDTPNWAKPAVNSLAARQILGDFSGYNVKPSQAATRAEVAGIVTKAMGIYTDITGASKFLDVTLTDSYYISTAVAVEYGIINGYGDNTFKPDRNITRQEAAAILARTLRLAKNQETSQSSTLTDSKADMLIAKFNDADTVADWAKIDVAECVQAGIINGDNKGNINPNANVTRAEIVQMVYNLLTQYGYIDA